MIFRMKRAKRGRKTTMFWMFGPYLWLVAPWLFLFAAGVVWILVIQTAVWSIAFIGPWIMLCIHTIAMAIVARRSILVRREDSLMRSPNLSVPCGWVWNMASDHRFQGSHQWRIATCNRSAGERIKMH